ncbi:MAG: ABC transporter ATP-binding protein [Planctomycetes bacterium]|nr:ABC transporter ATP-binding protein [Planctomycetota bacterium]
MDVLLAAKNVRVEFGKLVAVRDISFELHAGDLLGLIGPNGAGKTTLLRVLAGLHAPTAGTAEVMGHDVFRDSDRVRGHIGFAPDSPPVYEEVTLEQFLMFIARCYGLHWQEAEERIDFWLEQLWLNDKRDQKIKNLSRGMRQRVTVARTLIPNPTVILLDEPSAGLDPAGRIQLRQVFANLRDQGHTLIVSSHILADLEEFCTHIAIIEHGRVLQFGRARELAHDGHNLRRYRIVLDAGLKDPLQRLQGVAGVAAVEQRGGEFLVDHVDGTDAGSALLRQLIDAGLPIAEFGPLKASLEEAYLRSGVKQVD